MIPSFPEWKRVELSDREEIRLLTRPFLPNADHSVALLWSWNAGGEIRVSRQGSHLLLRVQNPNTGIPSFSFCGDDDALGNTANRLLDVAAKELPVPELRLMSEQVVKRLNAEYFEITDDPAAADYLLSAQALAELDGPLYASKRHACSKFCRQHVPETRELDLGSVAVVDSVLELSTTWLNHRLFAGRPLETHGTWAVGEDHAALERMMCAPRDLDIVGVGTWARDRLVAFTLTELLPPPYAIVHFIKAETTLSGVVDHSFRETARILWREHRRTVLNFEEDCGVAGLRKYKLSLRPFAFLRKHSVRWRV